MLDIFLRAVDCLLRPALSIVPFSACVCLPFSLIVLACLLELNVRLGNWPHSLGETTTDSLRCGWCGHTHSRVRCAEID